MRLRTTARPGGAPPSPADTAPVITKARSTATTVAGIRQATGGTKITINGHNAANVNDSAEDSAACHGLLSSSGSIPSSTSAWAAKGLLSVSSSATVRAVAG